VRVYTEIRDPPQGDDNMIDTTLGGEKKKKNDKNETMKVFLIPLFHYSCSFNSAGEIC
jgi:hypothetical protein